MRICLFICSLLSFSFNQAQLPASANGKFVKVKGLDIYYEESGIGDPIILLHGFTRTAADWEPLARELSKTNRVIAIDLPGHGRSGLMDSTNIFLHKREAEYILGLIDQLGLNKLQIVGFSSGSFITLYIVTMRPDVADKIILGGAQVAYSDSTRKVMTAMGNPAKQSEEDKIEQINFHGAFKAKLIAEQFYHFRLLKGDPYFEPKTLAKIKARTLIMHGDSDEIAPLENAWILYKHIPKARLWVAPFGPHPFIFFPQYSEEFSKLAKEFLLSR